MTEHIMFFLDMAYGNDLIFANDMTGQSAWSSIVCLTSSNIPLHTSPGFF